MQEMLLAIKNLDGLSEAMRKAGLEATNLIFGMLLFTECSKTWDNGLLNDKKKIVSMSKIFVDQEN